jgi:hypothetical protein
MSPATRSPRVVAELGRPELPEETAARLAENSRKYRARKTLNNLVLSLLATLVTVFIIVLIVPRSDTPLYSDVDYHAVAEDVRAGVDVPIADPVLPEGWRANTAEWSAGGSDKIRSWYVGFLTPSNQFVGMTQALDANPTWLAEELKKQAATDTVTVDGVTWDVYRNSAPEEDRGNFEYALATTAGTSTFVLVGTATENDFGILAGAVAADVRANGAPRA